MIKRATKRLILYLLAAALLLPAGYARAEESGEGWRFEDGKLWLSAPDGIQKTPYMFSWADVTELYLGSAVEEFFMCNDVPFLLAERITVHPQNPRFYVENGMLIDKELSTLVAAEIDIVDAVIPEGVSVIGMASFSRHTQLRSVHMPEGVTTIDEGAFEDCTNLEHVRFPEGSLKTLGTFAFSHCSGLKSIALPKSLTFVGGSAFSDCYRLKSAYISVPTSFMFYNCTTLQSVTFETPIDEIPDGMFYRCRSLEEIDLSGHPLKTISERAFEGCWDLRTVYLPDSVKRIEALAFRGCEKLRPLVLPEGVDIAPASLPYPTRTPLVTPEPTPTPTPTASAAPPAKADSGRGFFVPLAILLLAIGALLGAGAAWFLTARRRKTNDRQASLDRGRRSDE